MLLRKPLSALAGLSIALIILAACVFPLPAPPAVPASAGSSDAPVDAPAPAPPPTDELRMLRANSWQWIAFDEQTGRREIETPASYRVTFNSDASLTIVADCTNASGSYQGESGKLTIEIGPVNMTGCSAQSDSNKFIDLLARAVSYTFEDGNLRVALAADGDLMTFASTEEPANAETLAVASRVAAVPFDLGDAILSQTDDIRENLRDMPIRLNGLIAAPPTGEDLPIAVVIHGSHGSGCSSTDGMTEAWPCPGEERPNYAGFQYLIEDLAAHGYVAVSINANPAYVMAYGEARPNMRLPILFDLTMARLAAVDREEADIDIDLAGRVDWSKLVVLGHSQGGEGVNWIVDGRAGNTAPEQIAAGQGPVAAAILLAPSATSTRNMEMAVPFAVILPACDRDVTGLDGQYYYEDARTAGVQRNALVASVYLPGANHNRFNSQLEDETLGRTSIVCEGALLPAAAQQQFLADYARLFFDAALDRGQADTAALGIDPKAPAPATLLGRTALTSLALPAAQRLTLPLHEEGAGGTVTAVLCQQGYQQAEDKMEACRRRQFNQPGYPEQLALAWQGSDAVYTVNLPEESRNLSEYGTLHLRAAVDPISLLNEPGQPQSFSLRLTDGAGNGTAVSVAGEPALVFPTGKKGFDDSPGLDTWDNHVLLSSIRVPLAAFSGVDLSDVQSVALVFDAADSGAIFIADLELLMTDMPHPTNPATGPAKPDYVTALEAAYGAPSQAGFGSAVFYEPVTTADGLDQAALAKYRFFVGDLWERYGEAAWMGPWRRAHTRPAGGTPDIVAELRGIDDRQARLSASMVLDEVEDAETARAALAAAFNDPAVSELAVYTLGDGAAMAGILVAGRRGESSEATFLVFLLD
jgi:heat shock protein HslJ